MCALHARRAFTLMELMVGVTLLAILMGLLIPAIQHSRESARKAQCVNNLKQIGLGIQNFHDIRQEICPAYLTTDNGPSAEPRDYAVWVVIVIPYMEQSDWFELFDLAEPLGSDLVGPLFPASRPGDYGHPRAAYHSPDHPTARRLSASTFFCPTRRGPPQLTVNGQASVGDYACVSRADGVAVNPLQPRTWDAAMLPSRCFNASKTVAIINGVELEPGEYRALTNFASVTDGLSNTIFAGEKGVRADRWGGDKTDFSNTIRSDQQDGTYYYGGLGVRNDMADLREPGAIAYWSRRLVPESSSTPLLPRKSRSDNPENRFGGWHSGVTYFLLGDGSAIELSNATSNRVLQQMGCRNDQSARPQPTLAQDSHAG